MRPRDASAPRIVDAVSERPAGVSARALTCLAASAGGAAAGSPFRALGRSAGRLFGECDERSRCGHHAPAHASLTQTSETHPGRHGRLAHPRHWSIKCSPPTWCGARPRTRSPAPTGDRVSRQQLRRPRASRPTWRRPTRGRPRPPCTPGSVSELERRLWDSDPGRGSETRPDAPLTATGSAFARGGR